MNGYAGRNSKKGTIIVFIFGALCAVAFVTIIVFIAIGTGLTEIYKANGPWGDFVGGTLNPILTFFTVIGVLLTLILQKDELNLTREELSRSADALENQIKALNQQRFESTFFQMLLAYNTVLESIEKSQSSGAVVKGRARLQELYRSFLWEFVYRDVPEAQRNNRDIVRSFYDAFYEENRHELGHYYRYLYNFIKYTNNTNTDNKQTYIKLIKSQLSDQELAMLYYNCLSEKGEKFRKLAESVALFDNLPIDLLLLPSHKGFLSSSAFGETGKTQDEEHKAQA
jgi:hypothetical protein